MTAIKSVQPWLTGFFCILFVSACATPQQTINLLKSPPDIPAAIELVSTPFYPQRDYQCGPAALATVINFHQQQTSADDLVPLVYTPKLKGSLQVEMLAASRRFNRLAITLDGSLLSLLKEVANGTPVLVMQNLGLESFPFWHYAVVIGYDLNRQQIILRSGENKRLVRPLGVFERTWQRAGYWSVVVVPPGVMPVSVNANSYTQTALQLEPYLSIENTKLLYQTGIKRWPDNFILRMGLGNAAYASQNYAIAETSFMVATTLKPGRAEAWNNLAYALMQQGKKQQALSAVGKAIQLAPENAEYKNSAIEIKSSFLKNHVDL